MADLIPSQPGDIFYVISIADLADSTKRKYSSVISAYLETGNQLTDSQQLTAFSITLSGSRRANLKSAIKLWSDAMINQVKGQATPENIAQVDASIYRFQALQTAVTAPGAKGQKAHTWLSQSEVTDLMAAVVGMKRKDRRDRLVLGLLVGAGLRREEAASLTFGDIKTQPIQGKERTVLQIHGKGSKSRVVPISDKLVRIINDWRAAAGGHGLVLRSIPKGGKIGKSLSASALFVIVRRYGNLIGKPQLAPHDLRRTYAQIGYEVGVPVTQIGKLLGHESIETTQRYLNLELNLELTVSDFIPL